MPVMIEQITYGSAQYKATLALREAVLRLPLGMRTRPEDTSNDSKQIHFAAIKNESIVGCIVLFPQPDKSIKLRQMAIAESQRGKGIVAALVSQGEHRATE